jgi:hypothetical protein
MKKNAIVLFYFLAITGKFFAQDICLHPLPQDSSGVVFYECNLGLLQSVDLDQDGKSDLITDFSNVNFSTFQTFYYSAIMNSNGDGSFTGGGMWAPSPATGSTTGDFNEDGDPDFVIAYASGSAVFYISNGSGGFNSASVTLTSYLGKTVTGDFDNDGHEDVMVGSLNPIIYFIHGNGNGSFAPQQTLTVPGNATAYNLQAADVNTDGVMDVIWSGHVMLSNGAGNFTITSPAMPHSFIGIADINNDGFVDAIGNDSVFLGSGYGNFLIRLPLNLGAGFNIITKPVDLNNDNDPDLIVSKGDGQGLDSIYAFLGSTNATFIQSQFFMPVQYASNYQVTTGDFDGNGFEDFIMSRDSNAFEQCISILQPVMNYSANIISASTSVCQGDSLQLSVNNPGQILWSTGDTTSSIYVSAPGNYSVTTTTSSGCSSTDVITINQINATSFSSINSTNHFCLYASPVALTSGAPAGGTYSGPGIVSGTFDPQAAGIGTHTLVYTYAGLGGCAGTASLQVTVDLCLGLVENNSAEEKMNVYPNPCNGQFIISTDEKEFTVTVYDLSGKKVYSSANEKSINIISQPKGIYFVQLIAGDKIYSQKIILQ